MQRVPVTGYIVAPCNKVPRMFAAATGAATSSEVKNSGDDEEEVDSSEDDDDDDEDRFAVDFNDDDGSKSLNNQPLRRKQGW